HEPSRVAKVHPNATFVRCVHIAGLVAEHLLVPDDEKLLGSLTNAAQRILGMSKLQLANVIKAVKSMAPEMERVFETRILVDTQSDPFLEEARAALLLRNLQSLQAVSQLKDQTDSLEARTKELEESSRRDELTGLFNRRYLDTFLT